MKKEKGILPQSIKGINSVMCDYFKTYELRIHFSIIGGVKTMPATITGMHDCSFQLKLAFTLETKCTLILERS